MVSHGAATFGGGAASFRWSCDVWRTKIPRNVAALRNSRQTSQLQSCDVWRRKLLPRLELGDDSRENILSLAFCNPQRLEYFVGQHQKRGADFSPAQKQIWRPIPTAKVIKNHKKYEFCPQNHRGRAKCSGAFQTNVVNARAGQHACSKHKTTTSAPSDPKFPPGYEISPKFQSKNS